MPSYTDNPDSASVEVGVKFQVNVAGYVTGIRFYKGSDNVGTHLGNLWSSDGTLLATATFTAESASGWQQVNFSQPVLIQANTTLIASYFAPSGNYADDLNFFTSPFTDGPLTATGSMYLYSATSGFPTQTFANSNYYVDLVFSPLLGAITPANGALGVATDSTVAVQFLTAMNPATITTSTIQLQDAQGNPVTAAVAYDAAPIPRRSLRRRLCRRARSTRSRLWEGRPEWRTLAAICFRRTSLRRSRRWSPRRLWYRSLPRTQRAASMSRRRSGFNSMSQ